MRGNLMNRWTCINCSQTSTHTTGARGESVLICATGTLPRADNSTAVTNGDPLAWGVLTDGTGADVVAGDCNQTQNKRKKSETFMTTIIRHHQHTHIQMNSLKWRKTTQPQNQTIYIPYPCRQQLYHRHLRLAFFFFSNWHAARSSYYSL